MKDETYTEWIAQQSFSTLLMLCALIIVFHPAFHFILGLIPGLPPDSLNVRLFVAAVAAASIAVVLLRPALRRYAPALLVLNATLAIIVSHLVVFDSGIHPMYLATSLTAVYGAQLSFVRMREWLITVALVAAWYVFESLRRGLFGSAEGLVPPLFYVANYVISTALVWVRVQSQHREFASRVALQRSNAGLRLATDRLHNELVLAREIQQSLLPAPAPRWSQLDIMCYSQPAREVGGDFYSYHRFDDRRIALAIGDVSGKGASAALLMATSLSLFNANVVRRLQPSILVRELDQSLLPYTQPRRQNCALCYVELDGSTLCVVNAGAVPPYLRRGGQHVEWPDAWGFALGQGLGAEQGYQPVLLDVGSGDLVVLVSDGFVEAKNAAGAMFSFDRLEAAIRLGPTVSAAAMVAHLVAELQRFVGTTEPHDDVTLVVARVLQAA